MEQALTSDARPIPEHVVDGLVRFDHTGLLTEEDGREMIRRIRSGCCARAASGQAAAAPVPSRLMNSRRLMGTPQPEGHTLSHRCRNAALCITAKLIVK